MAVSRGALTVRGEVAACAGTSIGIFEGSNGGAEAHWLYLGVIAQPLPCLVLVHSLLFHTQYFQ